LRNKAKCIPALRCGPMYSSWPGHNVFRSTTSVAATVRYRLPGITRNAFQGIPMGLQAPYLVNSG
jgi:hypothetical protein